MFYNMKKSHVVAELLKAKILFNFDMGIEIIKILIQITLKNIIKNKVLV